MENNEEIITELNKTLSVQIVPTASREQLTAQLAVYINSLIDSDFQQLVYILYRVDVNETRLKKMLIEWEGKDAGMIIAQLLIERQLQKIQSRHENRNAGNHIDEDEKW